MIHEKIQLWSEHEECYLVSYLCENVARVDLPPRKTIIVCPGGGYEFLSEREAEPIAKKYLAEGLNVFVLYYSVGEKAKDFVPIIELAMAITHVRENCELYNVDPNAIFVTGFSAGGHLAASSATLWNHSIVRKALGIEDGVHEERINRPTGVILCYPVITAGEFAHRPSIANLCGKKEYEAVDGEIFSLEKQVNSETVPAFIWHTFADKLVSVQNTMLYSDAMLKHKIPFELHIYPHGSHGLSLATWEVGSVNDHVKGWFDLAVRWIYDFDKIYKNN